MNLHQIANAAIVAVNPNYAVVVKISTGWTTGPDGVRAPTYQEIDGVFGQIQALTFRDIQQIAGLNLQGTRKAVYLSGEVDGLVRSSMKGGDLILFPDGSVWLVAMVLEQWPDWVKAAVTLQNNA